MSLHPPSSTSVVVYHKRNNEKIPALRRENREASQSLTWHFIIVPSLDRKADVEYEIGECRYQREQSLLGQECPHVNVDCELDVLVVARKGARLSNQGGFSIVSLDELRYTNESMALIEKGWYSQQERKTT